MLSKCRSTLINLQNVVLEQSDLLLNATSDDNICIFVNLEDFGAVSLFKLVLFSYIIGSK